MAKKSINADRSGTRALRRVARHFTRRASRALVSPGPVRYRGARRTQGSQEVPNGFAAAAARALGVDLSARNAALRDAAHALNAARDAKVITQTLQSLRRNHRALQRNAGITELLRTLQVDQAALRRSLREHPAQLARTRSALEQLCGRVTHWRVGTHGWSVLAPAVKRIYQAGWRALPSATPRPTDRALHEWRKQVKYLRYALEILEPIRGRRFARFARHTGQLTDRLGEAHDLAMLTQKSPSFPKRQSRGPRALACDHRPATHTA